MYIRSRWWQAFYEQIVIGRSLKHSVYHVSVIRCIKEALHGIGDGNLKETVTLKRFNPRAAT